MLLPAAATPVSTQAQSGERCFAETGFCVSGRLLQYWEQNGGLPVFGLPITPQREETIGDWTGQVQWFERNRLELHPENAPPYDVLLGRLGAEFVASSGGPPPRQEPRDGCTYFDETGYNVCGAFLAYWSASGLDLGEPGISPAESLALFGLPLTGEFEATLADGTTHVVQWFERARFELHPENAPPYNVLLTRLGADVVGEPEVQPGTPAVDENAAIEAAVRAYFADATVQLLNVRIECIVDGTYTSTVAQFDQADARGLLLSKETGSWVVVETYPPPGPGMLADPESEMERIGFPRDFIARCYNR
jgi:hypothetical protein